MGGGYVRGKPSALANHDHERINAALHRAENATYSGSREALAAYDELVAELTRHLFAMEAAVLPVAARALPGGAGTLRPQIDRLRQLEAIQLRLEELRGRHAESVEALRGRLVGLMEAHRREVEPPPGRIGCGSRRRGTRRTGREFRSRIPQIPDSPPSHASGAWS
ncbi:MAG: hemerythrin domain-containing protein [Frankiaceae bacterium]